MPFDGLRSMAACVFVGTVRRHAPGWTDQPARCSPASRQDPNAAGVRTNRHAGMSSGCRPGSTSCCHSTGPPTSTKSRVLPRCSMRSSRELAISRSRGGISSAPEDRENATRHARARRRSIAVRWPVEARGYPGEMGWKDERTNGGDSADRSPRTDRLRGDRGLSVRRRPRERFEVRSDQ